MSAWERWLRRSQRLRGRSRWLLGEMPNRITERMNGGKAEENGEETDRAGSVVKS